MMKRTIFGLIAATASAICFAQQQVYVDGHIRQDGTYVPPHYRTAPDSSRMNNWSTQGNVNPYTGQQGTVNPYQQPSPSQFGQPPRQHSRQYSLP